MGFWSSTFGQILIAVGLTALGIFLVYLILTGRMRRDRRRDKRQRRRHGMAEQVNRLTAGRASGDELEFVEPDPTGERTPLPGDDEASTSVNGLLRRMRHKP